MRMRFVLPMDGCDLAGERWAGDAGPTVVLLHEGVADRRGWHQVAGRLASRMTVVAYDRRGYGESPVSTSEFTDAGDLRAVMDREKVDRAWLVGASAGGVLALDAALLMPERVAGLVLIGTAVRGAPEAELDETEQRFNAQFEAAIEAGDDAEINRLDTWFWLDGPSSPEGRVGGAARDLAIEMNAIIIGNDAPDGAGDNGVDAWSLAGRDHRPGHRRLRRAGREVHHRPRPRGGPPVAQREVRRAPLASPISPTWNSRPPWPT